MRKDILINSSTGELRFKSEGLQEPSGFNWLEYDRFSEYIQAEILVPRDFKTPSTLTVNIPYTPVYLPIQLRLKYEDSYTTDDFFNNGKWMTLRCRLNGGDEAKEIMASELILVDGDTYSISFEEESAEVFSGKTTDFVIGEANTQNNNLLVQCVPGNNYRYPTTGVGMIKYVNSNVSQTELATVLKEEFFNDGVVIEDATWDAENNTLTISANYENLE